jgi:hypothetical protein
MPPFLGNSKFEKRKIGGVETLESYYPVTQRHAQEERNQQLKKKHSQR